MAALEDIDVLKRGIADLQRRMFEVEQTLQGMAPKKPAPPSPAPGAPSKKE